MAVQLRARGRHRCRVADHRTAPGSQSPAADTRKRPTRAGATLFKKRIQSELRRRRLFERGSRTDARHAGNARRVFS